LIRTLLKLLLFAACFFAFYLHSSGVCSAEKTYQITEAELTQLEQNFKRQETVIARLSDTLKTLRLTETEARAQLEAALSGLEKTRSELTLLREGLKNSQNSLRKANLSLQEYGQEMKRKTRRLKAQRNIWFVGCALALGLAAGR
jgi:peptidoglycan hydrolase CwlO-like protein